MQDPVSRDPVIRLLLHRQGGHSQRVTRGDAGGSSGEGKFSLMSEVLYDDSDQSMSDAYPPEIARIVVRDLTLHGFDVRVLDQDDERCLTISNAECARCKLNIEDDGSVMWEYKPRTRGDTDPAILAQLVRNMLSADDFDGGQPSPGTYSGATLKSSVGQALDDHGMNVHLAIYEDTASYDVNTEIVVTNPERPERGQVRLSDNADITWEWGSSDGSTGSAEDVARAFIGALTEAIPMLKPGSSSADASP